MQKNYKKICIYQKNVLPLHRLSKMEEVKSLGEDLKTTQPERGSMAQKNRTGKDRSPNKGDAHFKAENESGGLALVEPQHGRLRQT